MPRIDDYDQTAVPASSSDTASVMEIKRDTLAQLYAYRNEIPIIFSSWMSHWNHHYQPFCFRDHFLYTSRVEFFRKLSLVNACLSEMQLILQNTGSGWEACFDHGKSLFDTYSSEMNIFLQNLQTTQIDNSGLQYFKISECYREALKTQTDCPLDIAEQVHAFIDAVDHYRRYFNAQDIMPEVRELRELIQEADNMHDDITHPNNHLLILATECQMMHIVTSLQEDLGKARRNCERMCCQLEKVMPLPKQLPPLRFFIPHVVSNSALDSVCRSGSPTHFRKGG